MERTPYPSETQDRFIVRFPDGMRDRLKDAAHTNGRSMNAEIVARLQQSLDGTEMDSLSEKVGKALLNLLETHSHPSSDLPSGLKVTVERLAPALGRAPNWESGNK